MSRAGMSADGELVLGGPIDLHLHVLPAVYLDELPDGLRARTPPWSMAALESHLELVGAASAVLSLPPPGVYFGDTDRALAAAQRCNDWFASRVAASPRRFAALATLPLPDVDAAMGELERALDVLGLDGVAVLSNADGVYPGHPSLEPLLR